MKAKNSAKEPKFEESLARLEGLVQEMESGDLPLEDILKKYEEGNRLIKFCFHKLTEAEKRIEVLMKEKDGGVGLKELDLDEDDAGSVSSGPRESSQNGKNEQEEDLF